MGKKSNIVRSMVLVLATMVLMVPVVLSSPVVHAADLGGQPVVLEYWLPNYPEFVEITRIFSADLEKLGIKLNVKATTYDEWSGVIVGSGNNPYHLAACGWGSSPDRLDPDFFLTVFSSTSAPKGGRNYGYYENPEYDKLVLAQRKETDRTKRQQLVWKAQETLHNDSVNFVVFYKAAWQAYNSDRIEGAVPMVGSGVGYPYIPITYLNGKPKTEKKEITAISDHDLISLNPFYIPDVENEWWLRLIYDPLVRRDENLNMIPWACTSWKFSSPTSVDFVLREGMSFHDGKPVTLDDLKFTVDFILEWKFPILSRIWRNVTGTEKVDKNTLRLNLKEPYAPFMETVLPYMFIAPKHIWEKAAETSGVKNPVDWANPNPIGSGAYKFDLWKKGEYFHLKAHKSHFNAPQFDGLYYKIVASREAILAAMEKGEADVVAWNLDAVQGKRLGDFPHLTAVNYPSIGMSDVRPNLRKAPTNDLAFRRALNHAMNRKLMLEICYGGYGDLGGVTPIAPIIKFWHNSDLPVPEYDLDKAREILKKAGYTWDSKGNLCYPKNM